MLSSEGSPAYTNTGTHFGPLKVLYKKLQSYENPGKEMSKEEAASLQGLLKLAPIFGQLKQAYRNEMVKFAEP